MLRKIKEKVKKVVAKKKVSVKKAAVSKRVLSRSKPGILRKAATRVKEGPPFETKKEFLGAGQVAVEKAKFSHPEVATIQSRRQLPRELPSQYGRDMMVLQVRDPRWLYSFWEVRNETLDKFKNELREEFYKAKRVLRVYDVTQVNFNGRNANRFFDIEINEFANNWYIDTNSPGRSWCVDLGLLLPSGKFITILRSNIVGTPLDGPSWITDEEWMVPDEIFARLYGLGFGLGQSSPVGRAWQERIKQVLFSGALSSPGITSGASPVRLPKGRKFWLVVDCELIVYGATEPDAKVTVQGKPIKLRQDGTFTLRFGLPDGKQNIPVKAVSADKVEERTITPIVSRETRIG